MSSPTTPSPAKKKLRQCSPRPFQLPPFPQSSSPGGSVSSPNPAQSPPVSSDPFAPHAGSRSPAFPTRSPAWSARSPTLSSVPLSTPALSGAQGPRRRIPFAAPLPVPILSYPAPPPPLMVDIECFRCRTERAIVAAIPCGHRLFCGGCGDKVKRLGKPVKCPRCRLEIKDWNEVACENAAAAYAQGAQQQPPQADAQ